MPSWQTSPQLQHVAPQGTISAPQQRPPMQARPAGQYLAPQAKVPGGRHIPPEQMWPPGQHPLPHLVLPGSQQNRLSTHICPGPHSEVGPHSRLPATASSTPGGVRIGTASTAGAAATATALAEDEAAAPTGAAPSSSCGASPGRCRTGAAGPAAAGADGAAAGAAGATADSPLQPMGMISTVLMSVSCCCMPSDVFSTVAELTTCNTTATTPEAGPAMTGV